MKKLFLIIPIIIVALLLIGGIVYLSLSLRQQKQENADMQALAEMDKQEMENEYQQFANQYSEMRAQITNDSIIAQLSAEQEKTEHLLAELRRVKSNDAREIARLKRELATVRAVLRSYVLEIDSLNRLNENLTAENTRIKVQYDEATKEIEGLNSVKESLSEKVAIASQLDATAITLTALNKRGKATTNIKKCRTLRLTFNLAKNVTAQNGARLIYTRIVGPTGSVLGNAGTFDYENRTLQCTMKKSVEYGGEETPVILFWTVTSALSEGTYNVSVFSDGEMIGSRSVNFK